MLHRHLAKLLAAVVALHLLAAGWYATFRPIDGDEGFYALAARLVTEGRTPYLDFFYPQSPLLPYLYAPGAALIGAPQLPGLRSVSVLWSVLCLGLAAWWLRRVHGGKPSVALAALLLLAFSPELLLWHTTVKTYAWNNLAALAALLAVDHAASRAKRRRTWWLVGGGTMAGLGISSRLLYAPLAVAGLVWLLHDAYGRRRAGAAWRSSEVWRDPAAWALGLVIGLAPVWLLLARDADGFWFNNVTYHDLRINILADAPLHLRWLEKLSTFGSAVLASPGLLLLVALSVWGGWQHRRCPPREPQAAAARLSLLLAVVHTLASLLPEPVHRQYFTATLPVLLLPAAAAGLAALPAVVAARGRLVLGCLAPLLAAAWLGLVRPDIDPAPQWRLDHYRRVSRLVAAVTSPDDVVFSFWSGYAGGAGRQPYPGLENHFGVSVSERLDAAERQRYRIAGRWEMAAGFRRETPAVVILGNWMHDLHHVLDNEQTQELLDIFTRHYGFFDEVRGVKVCKRLRDLERRSGS